MRQTLASTSQLPATLAWREVVFTLPQARRALPYVTRIARDAAAAFEQANRCRVALNAPLTSSQHQIINERREDALRRLNSAIDECNAVGVDLIDLRKGVVRFNVILNGKRTALTWSLGDSVEHAWPNLVESGSRTDAARS